MNTITELLYAALDNAIPLWMVLVVTMFSPTQKDLAEKVEAEMPQPVVISSTLRKPRNKKWRKEKALAKRAKRVETLNHLWWTASPIVVNGKVLEWGSPTGEPREIQIQDLQQEINRAHSGNHYWAARISEKKSPPIEIASSEEEDPEELRYTLSQFEQDTEERLEHCRQELSEANLELQKEMSLADKYAKDAEILMSAYDILTNCLVKQEKDALCFKYQSVLNKADTFAKLAEKSVEKAKSLNKKVNELEKDLEKYSDLYFSFYEAHQDYQGEPIGSILQYSE